jgi:peptidyl-tRNA hydrolase
MLGTEEVPRLRCGIGPERKPAANDLSDFVLSPFENGETEIVQGMVERAADAVLSVARLGVAQAMNVVNA